MRHTHAAVLEALVHDHSADLLDRRHTAADLHHVFQGSNSCGRLRCSPPLTVQLLRPGLQFTLELLCMFASFCSECIGGFLFMLEFSHEVLQQFGVCSVGFQSTVCALVRCCFCVGSRWWDRRRMAA